jgi:hypothetical protein
MASAHVRPENPDRHAGRHRAIVHELEDIEYRSTTLCNSLADRLLRLTCGTLATSSIAAQIQKLRAGVREDVSA